MVEKKEIIEELGEEELLIPVLVNQALTANERVKYYFTLLQTARSHAERPGRGFSNLKAEREASGEENAKFDGVVAGAEKTGADQYRITHAPEILAAIRLCMDEMIHPVRICDAAAADLFIARYERLVSEMAAAAGGEISGDLIMAITSADHQQGDSLHLLVMDLHKALNLLQQNLSQEVIDGARSYLLEEGDREFVSCFMKGLQRTAPLKFDHPGLGTTATRTNNRLIIQNDIGETDAHVIVITISDLAATVTYTDVHLPRLVFFKNLFRTFPVQWEDTLSRSDGDRFESGMYHLAIGRYAGADREELKVFLDHLGSRLVFLIDWNRARKRLKNFLRNSDAISILSYAADNDFGHRGFLALGGEQLIYEALDLASHLPMRYGEPLYQVLGRERTMEYFRWVLQRAAVGLLSSQSELVLKDEIKAELLRYFRSAHQNLMEVCAEHASFMVEIAASLRDVLLHVRYGGTPDYVLRSAGRCKDWESEADRLVNKVRTLSKRIDEAEFFISLITFADDAVDYLEEAAWHTTFICTAPLRPGVLADLTAMAELAVRAAREYLRTLYAAQNLHRTASQEEMQDFLWAVDRVVNLEQECDDALRKAERTVFEQSGDFRESWLAFSLARDIEESTNSLMKAAYVVRDSILQNVTA